MPRLHVLCAPGLLALLAAGCACGPGAGSDAGVDAGAEEVDAGPVDAGAPDAGAADAGRSDAGPPDAGPPDAGTPDAGCYRLTARAGTWTTGRPVALELADLDGDGRLDFVVATTSALEVRLNDGQGGAASPSLIAPLSAQTLAVADLDGDGVLDLAAVDAAGVLTVLRGNGDGTFAVGARLDAGQPFYVPLDTALGDLDSDGRLEFVTLDVGFATPRLRTVHGALDGGAPRATTGSHQLVLAEVTGDGRLDALVGNAQYGLAVHPGDGDGGFGVPTVFLGSTAVNALALGDVTGDGVADAVCATGYYDVSTGFVLGGGVSVLPGVDGGFGAPRTLPGPDIIGAVVLADMNRDGPLDAVTSRFATNGGVEVLGGDDAGAFSLLLRVPGRTAWALAVGDLNADGWPDLVVGSGAGSNGEVTVLMGSCQ